MSDELSRVEDLLENGVEEPVEPMSEVEAILRGEKVKPHSRVSDLLLKYNPSDKLIKKTATTNGTYIARNDDADGYYEFVVDTPVAPQPTYDQLDETVTENGEYSYTPQHDAFDSVDFTVAVPGPVLGTKTVTENGTYKAEDDNVDGYSQVNVQVPSGGIEFPVYDFHTNNDGTIVVRRKIDYVNNEFSIETLWFFNGYQFTEWQADIPSNLLEFMTDDIDVSSKSYSDNTSATQNGWISISRAYYNDKLSCYTTDWYQNPNTEVWGVINIANGNSQTLEWSDPYDIGNGTIIDVGFKFIPSIYANTDGPGSATIDFNDPDMLKAPINHFFLNLYACYFTGSTPYTSSTTLSKTNDGHIQYAWTSQSGNTRQYFNIAYVKDLSAIKTLSDWKTYDSPDTFDIDVSDINNFSINNVLIDFKNVVSGGNTGIADNTPVSKVYNNGTLTIGLPLTSDNTKSIDVRILYIDSVLSSGVEYNADDLQIATSEGQYITNNFDVPLESGEIYIGALKDSNYSLFQNVPIFFQRGNGTQTISPIPLAQGAAALTITDTTASLSDYSGDWRNVWLRLSKVLPGQTY